MSAGELDVQVAPNWVQQFPGAHVGMLALDGLSNPHSNARLERRVREVEASLRQRHAGQQRANLAALPVVQAYQRHYKRFGQTYHVFRQLESVVLKDRPLVSPSALVLAMFAAELNSLLLTAAHDLDTLEPPIVVDASTAGETFIGVGGQQQTVRAGDMLMRDSGGIISAVIYGPDRRTRVHDGTTRVLFTTYAPAEIPVQGIRDHLREIAELVRLVCPGARTLLQDVFP